MNREIPLPPWLQQVLIGVGLFLAGGVIAFGYSYRPLHGALSWEVEQLETRLHERNRENLELSDAIAKLESSEAERIDPETLAQVERELDQTKRVLRQAEKDLKRAERKRKEANSSAATWRKRYEELRDAPTESLAAETQPAPAPAAGSSDPPTIAPAAADPSATGPTNGPNGRTGSPAGPEGGMLSPERPDGTIQP